MAIFKCKICGGALEIDSAQSVATCEYCGTKQTLPHLDDEHRTNLYDRANHFRRNNDFDKAMGIYENILNEDNTDAEAYWSIVLCRYGIEYVKDPATRRRVPTVNRAQFTSVFDDEDYKAAIANADGYQREIYETEATAINEIQKNILAISQKEEPFDVFICYKETDAGGRRTQDSVLATELYHELTREGFKVFFSRITLEDKLGQEYEPYIFAALNSAKVMVVLGTRTEHFNAAWVKNEWSRYLALIKNGAKKTLIPAYRDMDPYDLPEEFSHLQAQDMSKLGFMQDLTHGIKKFVKTPVPIETNKAFMATNTAPLLRRAFLFLENGTFDRADELCEQVLNQEPENAQAYLCKLLAELQMKAIEELAYCEEPFENNDNCRLLQRFADSELESEIKKYIHIRNQNAILAKQYESAIKAMSSAETEHDYISIAKLFSDLGDYKNSKNFNKQCIESAQAAHLKSQRDKKMGRIFAIVFLFFTILVVLLPTVILPSIEQHTQYNNALLLMNNGEYRNAILAFEALDDYQDSVQKIEECEASLISALKESFSQIKIGDSIMLGQYEQDNDFTNGEEAIEWIVLDITESGNALLISKYVLNHRKFHSSQENVMWYDSDLQNWLNNDFWNAAFINAEMNLVQKTKQHKVFVLSLSETNEYIVDPCSSTAYAKSQGVTITYGTFTAWWTRTKGSNEARFITALGSNSSDEYGEYCTDTYGVRPAIWINLH